MLLALSYVPEKDVQFALKIIAESFPQELRPLVDYLEDTYVGRRLRNVSPRFIIRFWNMFDKVGTEMLRNTGSLA